MTGPIVGTTGGPVQGRTEDGVDRFLGIPYAAAPFGALRFQAPQPHAGWSEPFQADRFGATSPQTEGASPGGLPAVVEPIIPGEEILNLNVWVPAERSGPLPVLVWIHGGGFVAGCSANPWYDGASFARQGLVVVSCNYRLGAEGFLELDGAPSNRGILDCIAALEWVRRDIAAFGGDPAAVTVMGQSAGGMAVAALLSAPRAAGLLARAVIASGVSGSALWSPAEAIAAADAVTEEAGIERSLEAARSVSPAELVTAHVRVTSRSAADGLSFGLPWGPVVDGDLLDGDLWDAVAQGRTDAVPVLVGSTANEFAWMGYRDRPDDAVGKAEGQRLLADDVFRLPIQRFADARADRGAAPTYRYEFEWHSAADPVIRAGHSLDIPFFFHTLDAPYVLDYTGPNPPVALADDAHGAFAAFARTGVPGWPAYSRDGAVQLFDTPSRVGRTADLGLNP